MITTARALKLSQLLTNYNSYDDKKKKSIWSSNEQLEMITHKSWVSLLLIIQFYSKEVGRTPVLYVPDYFCNDTLKEIADKVEIVFYNVTSQLLPDYKVCKELVKEKKPDLFIFTHFFGQYFDASTAANFCKSHDALLIEDAAHVFLPYKKIGVYGNFTLFSPWKSYGLPDGAVLIINKKGAMGYTPYEIYDKLKILENKLPNYPYVSEKKWIIKKIVQKALLKVPHLNAANKKCLKSIPYRVSRIGKSIIETVTLEEIKNIGERKKENYLVLLNYLKQTYHIEPLWEIWNGIPYMLVVKIESTKQKRNIINALNKIGEIATEWPELSENIPHDSIAKNLKESLLMIAIHDSINFQKIRYSLKLYCNDNGKDLKIEQITEKKYMELCSSNDKPLPILQSVIYTRAKQNTQGWKRQYWEIIDESNGNSVGEFVSLKKYGVIYRINHGPIIKSGYEKRVLCSIKKNFLSSKKILFIAPNMERNGQNLMFLIETGYRYQKKFSSTGIIDLRLDENSLRKNLDSKWRNCLKNAEKQGLSLEYIKEQKDFEILLSLHSKDKEVRNFNDSGDEITRYLFSHNALLCLTAKDNCQNIISFIMIALHGNTATYYIGWSNTEGYKLNANRLLLWTAIIRLKEIKVKWFDLGGIDFIQTKGIAEFKIGTGCKLYEYAGEFIV